MKIKDLCPTGCHIRTMEEYIEQQTEEIKRLEEENRKFAHRLGLKDVELGKLRTELQALKVERTGQ